jgi:hypothetical protein
MVSRHGRVPNPTENKFRQNSVEGAKREHAKPVSKKAPITSKALEECCIKRQGCDTLTVRRDISMALLLFAGFLRYNEIVHLKIRGIAIFDTHVRLIRERSLFIVGGGGGCGTEEKRVG